MLVTLSLTALFALALLLGKSLYERFKQYRHERNYFNWRNKQAQVDFDSLPENMKPQFRVNKEHKWHYLEKIS